MYFGTQQNSRQVVQVMRGLGLKVFVSHTLCEALQIADNQQIDSLVLDSIDHMQAVRAHVNLAGVPILLLSASGSIKDISKYLAQPTVTCIYTMPINPSDFYLALTASFLSDEAAKWQAIPLDMLRIVVNSQQVMSPG